MEAHDEFTDAFYEVHGAPEQISGDTEISLEYLTIMLYDRTSTCSSINEVRKHLLTHTKAVRFQPFLRPKLLSSNISKGQCCRQDTIGEILLLYTDSFPSLVHGDGLVQNNGNPCGQVNPALSYCSDDVEAGVETASVSGHT